MKKIPIILSGIAILSGYTGTLTGVAATQAISRENTNLTRTLAEDLTASPYEHFSNFKLDFDFANNWLGVATNVPIDEGDLLSWVTVVYRDVDRGVTEAEADKKAATLTDAEPDWAVVLQSQRVTAQSSSFALSLRKSMTLDMNPTDSVYYAAQFINQETGNTYWLRGKLNYRRCRHSTAFGQVAYECVATANETTRQVDYAVWGDGGLEVPSEEDILLSWEEEWTQYLEKKVSTLNQRIAELEKRLAEANGRLSDMENELTEKEQALIDKDSELTEKNNALVEQNRVLLEKDNLLAGKDAEISGLRAEVSGLRAEIERLQQGGGSASTDELENENRELRVQVQKLTVELQGVKASMTEQKEQFEAQRAELEQRLAAQEEEAKQQLATQEERFKQQLAAQEAEFARRIQEKEAQTASGVMQVTNSEAQANGEVQSTNGQEANGNQALDNVTTLLEAENREENSTENDVEIPNLGEETTVKLNIWWILAGIVGLFGVALFWLKRSFQSK